MIVRVPIWFYLIVAVLVIVRHLWRGAGLGDLCILVQTSKPCMDPTTRTCSLVVSADDDVSFDLGPSRRNLLGWLYLQLLQNNTDNLKEVLRGGHVAVTDANRSTYNFITQLPGAYVRHSSHKSDSKQYAIKEGRFLSTILMGHWKGRCWFQFEGAPWAPGTYPLLSFFHLLDYYEYRVTSRNVGPFGTSWHTDRHPLVLSPDMPSVATACPELCPVHEGDEDASDLALWIAQAQPSEMRFRA